MPFLASITSHPRPTPARQSHSGGGRLRSFGRVSPHARSGQVMIELIVALSVLTVGFLGVVQLLSKSIATNRNIADQYTAAYLAGEGVEIIKNLIDANIIANAVPGNPDNCDWGSGSGGINSGLYQANYDAVPNNSNQCPGKALNNAGGSPEPLRYNATTHFYKTGNSSDGGISPFTRVIRVIATADTIYVSSTVTFGSNRVVVEDLFTNWRP